MSDDGDGGRQFVIVRTTRETGEVRFYSGSKEVRGGVKENTWTPNRSKATPINEDERDLKMRGLCAAYDKEFKYTDETA